ncbi:MAG: hypothetical protein KDA90_06990 [Planctomycetaceae bacterium]|nr:hypothetical protein [Planctomycetaceae bacterium]
MERRLIIALGPGMCGLDAVVDVLNRQPNCQMTLGSGPTLPWDKSACLPDQLQLRVQRLANESSSRIFGDAGTSYLPYVRDIASAFPDVRFLCLQRPRDEVVREYIAWLKKNSPIPVNHWAQTPPPGWTHDPILSRCFPKNDVVHLDEGLKRYWDDYDQTAVALARELPDQFRVIDPEVSLNTTEGLQELLSFVGIPAEEQVILAGRWKAKPEPDIKRDRPMAPRPGDDPYDPRRCVVLVPYTTHIVPQCDESLKELERRGYPVRRVMGFAAIDQGRNQLATDALVDGFQETMWIDADVGFHPDDVDRLRRLNLPISSGIYAQKGRRAIASHVLPTTESLTFGPEGGVIEILYAATGFLHVRREVYLDVLNRLNLPICNERFEHPIVPYFHPMIHEMEDGRWYLAEDYSFSQRVRLAGHKIYADTRLRLWHFGSYPYGWEDAGRDKDRQQSFTLRFKSQD